MDNNNSLIPHLKLCLLSGDWIPINLPDRIKKHCSKAVVMSLGGATEGSIWSIWYEIDKVREEWSSIPYGVAMPNQKIYVLNHNNEYCPVGVVGEIYIGGAGVALNYWRDNEQTNASFIEHGVFGRIYKTGDIGKYHKDGYIEFLGRRDHQVKLNGYRIELEEISCKLAKLDGIEDAIVKIQKDDDRDYIVGYILPKSFKQKQDAKEIPIAKESFVLEQRGILQNLKGYYKLKLNLNEAQYRLRKSYRNFIRGDIELAEVVAVGNKVINVLETDRVVSAKTTISKTELINILSTISGIKLDDRVLPKYRYPSGGSSYAVRCFINIVEPLDNITSGYYYYNPVDYVFCKFNNWEMHKSSQMQHELHLIVNWPSIKPIYGNFSKTLAYIEVGHMLGLLLEELHRNAIGYKLEILEKNIDSDNTFVAKLILGAGSEGLLKPSFKMNYLYKDEQGQCFASIDKNTYFDLTKQSIFTKNSEFDQLLNNGKLLVTIEGNKSTDNLIVAGLLFQRISDELYKKNIGSCMLGFTPYKGMLYSMVVGKIDDSEKRKSSSDIKKIPLYQIINKELSKDLPEYMLPYGYVILDKLPLSANGKLEINKLAKLQIQDQTIYVAPRNEFESLLCQIWSEVLGLDRDKVGIRDDFFRLGGNSVLAIRLTSKINNYYQSYLKVSDIFAYKNIELLLPRILQTKDSYQTIVKLNNTYKKPNMFMIHPGIGGCEVYISLSNTLVNDFSCYGVDSYNLYHGNHIDNMHELAKYYLSYIDKVMMETRQEMYYILGWSLGGQIALEIACILEQRGDTKVKVYLLDTIFCDSNLFSALDAEVEWGKNQFREDAILKGYEESYITKSILNIEVEKKLAKQKISSILNNAHVLLFKAMLGDMKFKIDKYNNIDKFIKNKSNIKLVTVFDAHHGNILEQEKLLVSEIVKHSRNPRMNNGKR